MCTHKARMYDEMRVNADGHDQQHSWHRAHLDTDKSECAQQLHRHRRTAKHDQRSGPHVEKHYTDNQEDDAQSAKHGQVQVLSQTLVLLPEDERYTGWEVGQASGLESLAQFAYLRYQRGDGERVTQPLQVERNLSVSKGRRFRYLQLLVIGHVAPRFRLRLQIGLRGAVGQRVVAHPR